MSDSPFSVKYEGFKPDDQLDAYIKFWLYKILEYCPYDSFIHVKVLALTNRYLVDLNVKYIHEQFHGLGEEITIEMALEAAEKSIYQQVKSWRENRFGDEVKVSHKINVLVVDDDPLSTKLIEACLSEQGCKVSQASSGNEAIFKLNTQDYNLVVMDWNMRPLSGRQTLKIMDSKVNVNKGASRSKIPVLTYSVYNQDKISFPRTENLYQFAHLSKTSSFKNTYSMTKKLIEQLNGYHNNFNQPA